MSAGKDKLRGAHVLLVTPFTEEGSLDRYSLGSLIEFVIAGGVAGVVGLGTTGEFFTLSPEERAEVMDAIVAAVAGRIYVTFGIGDSATATSIWMAKHAEKCNADAVMLQPPYYFQHTNAGGEAHVLAVAEAISTPIMIYDGASGIEVPTSQLVRLSAGSSLIQYVKIATPQPTKIADIKATLPELGAFCGDENMLVLARRLGAVGSTVGIGNVVPSAVADLEKAVDEGRLRRARQIQAQQIVPLVSVCTMEKAGYIRAYKEILAQRGVIASPFTRLPLGALHPLRREEVLAVAQDLDG